MTDKTDAWMPLWIGAYLADTTKLTTVQHGAYLLLLMAYWRERKPLPDDDEDLRSITKCDRGEWAVLRPKMAGFFTVADGVWWHKRVEEEMAVADKRKASAVAKASAGGQALAKKRVASAPSTAPSTPQAVLGECPTPSPLPTEEKKARKRAAPEVVPCPDDVDEQTWNDWVAHRAKKRATVTAAVVKEARVEAEKAGMPLGRFLAVWCFRGTQGLQAEWLAEKGSETAYQRSMRERAAEIHPAIARALPGATKPNPMEVLDGLTVARIAG